MSKDQWLIRYVRLDIWTDVLRVRGETQGFQEREGSTGAGQKEEETKFSWELVAMYRYLQFR